MPVTTIPVSSRLQLRLNTGLDENFEPIYRTRSFSNVKTGADNAVLFEVAEGIGGLQVHAIDAIRRIDEVELEQS